jgi:hypothetical protein
MSAPGPILPTPASDDQLIERSHHLAGQVTDPRQVTILSALLIAEEIRRGLGRLYVATTKASATAK